jgi:hypothetical protein
MTPKEKEIRQKLKSDFMHYADKCLKIRSKSGDVIQFKLNKAQKYIHAQIEAQRESTGTVRAIVLKGRQQGCSSYVSGRFYHRVTHTFGIQAFILTHALDATQNLYKMAQRFYENTPHLIKPAVSTSNSKELIFGYLDSGYKIGTAENKSVGRSSTIQLFHGSEVAFWSNASEHAKGILQAIPNDYGTEIILESTANGVGNFFHQQWQRAEARQSEFIPIFVPWFWQEEYQRLSLSPLKITEEEDDLKRQYLLNDNQINWRRYKISEFEVNGQDGNKSFAQEYPCNAQEAFQLTGEDNYISSELVMKARKTTNVEAYGNLVIGADIARFGDDRTSFIRRKGRLAYNLESYVKKDTMQVAGLLHQIIVIEKPFKVLIDIGGLGAGVYDRLRELGHADCIIAVNAGSAALNQNNFSNKRAEMWALLKQWLQAEPCQIPDSDSLQADICNTKYSNDSNSRLVIEKKADMKKRGIRSSDEADALCLTFAYPTMHSDSNSKSNAIAARLMKTQDELLRHKERVYCDDFS